MYYSVQKQRRLLRTDTTNSPPMALAGNMTKHNGKIWYCNSSNMGFLIEIYNTVVSS